MANEQDVLVQLNADQQELLKKTCTEMVSGLSYVHQLAAKGQLSAELCRSILYVTESNLAQLSQLTGIETDSAKDREERYAMLRAANGRVRDLERQLGETVGATHVQNALKNLMKRLDRWWSLHGFGHVSEADIGKWGSCRLQLSGSLFGYQYTGSKTPASDRQSRADWLAKLEERGFELERSEGKGHEAVVDSDNSRKLIIKLIETAFPSATVTGFRCHRQRSGVMVLREIDVHLSELADIEALELDEEVEEA